jgi:predicted RNA-binding protein with TRAM domain
MNATQAGMPATFLLIVCQRSKFLRRSHSFWFRIRPDDRDGPTSGTQGDRGENANLFLNARRAEIRIVVDSIAVSPGLTGSRSPPAIGRKDPMRNGLSETATMLLVEQPDARLLRLAAECGGMIATNDAAFRQTAEEQGVPVMAMHELALALGPKVRQGEEIDVQITKIGKNRNEGIAYLDDGTMVVVEGGQHHVGATITVTVTSILKTLAGQMVFARPL